ncbi:MAG TPA: RHS repeat-associated core domain-containing protein [Dehalococcoidia bacterium]|nr:RHS repeat-associated core domain-containing protein [Dehalococcoidia bacterium]
MTSVVHSGIGKRRFGLRQKLWHRLAGLALIVTYNDDTASRLHYLVHQQGTAFTSLTYDYYADGNRKSLSTCQSTLPCTPGVDKTESYQYDSLNRLTRVDYSNDLTFSAYEYDPNGNRTLLDANNSIKQYDYNAADELTEIGSTQVLHDDNGNVQQHQGRTYAYDHEKRLTPALISDFDPAPNSCHDLFGGGTINTTDVLQLRPVFGTSVPPTSAFFDLFPSGNINTTDVLQLRPQFGQTCPVYSAYDGDGLRTANWTGKYYTTYEWDVAAGLPVVLQETTREIHNNGDIPDDISDVVTSDISYVYGLALISSTDASGDQRYYFTDGLGSTVLQVDGSGQNLNPEAFWEYNAFGSIRASGGNSDSFLFTGQQFDADTPAPEGQKGLYYLRARYYDPSLGRFLSRDPLQGSFTHPQTQNAYACALNNPTNRDDPTGRASESIDCNSIAGFGDCFYDCACGFDLGSIGNAIACGVVIAFAVYTCAACRKLLRRGSLLPAVYLHA